MTESTTIDFEYTFKFSDDRTVVFEIKLDAETLNLATEPERDGSRWAALENHQCTNCTLNPDTHPFCPISHNLVDILPHFKDVYSYEKVKVIVKNAERVYAADTTVQRGLGSMLGIYMVSSGCPILSKLKPMVRYHLPFASVEETVYRAASTYLLGQYFKHKKEEAGDWNLDGLKKIYEEIQVVNCCMAERLRSLPAKDANINALIVLDVFAKELPQNIETSLKPLEYLFNED